MNKLTLVIEVEPVTGAIDLTGNVIHDRDAILNIISMALGVAINSKPKAVPPKLVTNGGFKLA